MRVDDDLLANGTIIDTGGPGATIDPDSTCDSGGPVAGSSSGGGGGGWLITSAYGFRMTN